MNGAGRCWISNRTLADEMGLRSTTSAEDAKGLLIKTGWLVVDEEGGGRGRASVVEARFPVANGVSGRELSLEHPPGDAGRLTPPEPPPVEAETARPTHRLPLPPA